MSLSLLDIERFAASLRHADQASLAEALERLWTMAFPRVAGNPPTVSSKKPLSPIPSSAPSPAPGSASPIASAPPTSIPLSAVASASTPASSSHLEETAPLREGAAKQADAASSEDRRPLSAASVIADLFAWNGRHKTEDKIADFFEWIYQRPPNDPLLFRVLLSSLHLLLHLSEIIEPELRSKAPLLWDCYEVLQRERLDGRISDEMRDTFRRLEALQHQAEEETPDSPLSYAYRVFLEALLSGLKNAATGTVQAIFAWLDRCLGADLSPDVRDAFVAGVYRYLHASLWDE